MIFRGFHAMNMEIVSIQHGPCSEFTFHQKFMVCILARVMPNHIFIPCRWSVAFHLNLSIMRARGCKNWFGQSSCHPQWLCICFISKLQYEHITFMTIHYNTERWWGTVTSKSDVMVIHIKLLTNLSISEKASLRSLYIDMSLWPKSMPQNKGVILVKVCQSGTNTCPILYPTPITMPTWSTNIRTLKLSKYCMKLDIFLPYPPNSSVLIVCKAPYPVTSSFHPHQRAIQGDPPAGFSLVSCTTTCIAWLTHHRYTCRTGIVVPLYAWSINELHFKYTVL